MQQQLGIQIGTEFLDLLPGTTMQLQEQNPFLQLTDLVMGPYSLPFDIPHTEKNLRLLNLISAVFTDKRLVSYPAIVWENGIQHSIGIVKVEQVKGNFNDMRSGTSSLYYLTGTSTFYDLVQSKKLADLYWGGDRIFQGLTGTLYDRSFGFGKHLSDLYTAQPGTFDYCLTPIKNDTWSATILNTFTDKPETFKANFMNTVGLDGRYSLRGSRKNSAHTPLCPFPYLKYMLLNIFTQLGYALKGEILTDPNFIKICLPSFRDILYCTSTVQLDGTAVLQMLPTVTFDLQYYMPNVTVGEFLIALKNRFGWYYDFDLRSKTCTILYLKDVIKGQYEDITPFVEGSYLNKVDLQGQIYSLTQTLDESDSYPSAPDLSIGTFLGNFNTTILIAATAALEGDYVFLEKENAYYICRSLLSDPTIFEWGFLADNIYDYIPITAPTFGNGKFLGDFNIIILITPAANIVGDYVFLINENAFYICQPFPTDPNHFEWAFFSKNIYNYVPNATTTPITTSSTPLAQQHTSILDYSDSPGVTGIFPIADVQGLWQGKSDILVSWGIRLLFHHGPLPDDNGIVYPYASNHPIDNHGNLLGDWALSFQFSDVAHGHADGLYNIFWASFLSRIRQNETFTVMVRYPFSTKNNIKFGDCKIIQHTRFFIQQKTTIIPYAGNLQLDMVKV